MVHSTAQQFQVGPDTLVEISCSVFDAEGECVEPSDGEATLAFVVGYGQLPAKLENALFGALPGQSRRVRLSAREAFGPRDPEAIIEVDRAEFADDITPGDEFEAEHESGETVVLKVLEVNEEFVTLDTNHPLSGQAVELELFVHDVRPASSRELAEAQDELDAAMAAAEADDEAAETQMSSVLPVERLLRRGSSLAQATEQGAVPQAVTPPPEVEA
jgi:FKBP-type peptidyl-prolyl cis-trans isomerase 2